MNNAQWKFISISLLAACVSAGLTLLMRNFLDVAAIIFLIILVGTLLLVTIHPDIAEEATWVKAIVILFVLFGMLVASWDGILDFYIHNASFIQSNMIVAIALLGGGGFWYVSNRRTEN